MYVDEKQRITKTERKRKNVFTNVRFFFCIHRRNLTVVNVCMRERVRVRERKVRKLIVNVCVCLCINSFDFRFCFDGFEYTSTIKCCLDVVIIDVLVIV